MSSCFWRHTADESADLFRLELKGSRATYGDSHPRTLVCSAALVEVLSAQGKYAEAEPIMRENLALNQQTHGKKHSESLRAIRNLCKLLKASGNLDEAERLAVRVPCVWRHTSTYSPIRLSPSKAHHA